MSGPSAAFRVLLVEDNLPLGELWQYAVRKLERAAAVALTVAVTSGTEALERFGEDRFDLVIVDLDLPGRDGFELLRRLRAAAGRWTLKVVAIAAGGDGAEARALQVGADAFLRKPVRLAQVTETVREQLGLGALGGGAPRGSGEARG